jgi:predicted enzyme related to lactoylglutathione lyase
MAEPLIRSVDCVRLHVPDLESGLAFYRDLLGHRLVWRSATAAGLELPGAGSELVIQTEDPEPEVDFLVDSAAGAAQQFERAGGRLVVPPFEIQIGMAAVVEDPWGNRYVLLDMSKGRLRTGQDGRILGNAPVSG